MLLINGIYYNPAFITQGEDLSDEEGELIALYFSVPVSNSLPCVALSDGKRTPVITLCVNHNLSEDEFDAWMIEVSRSEDIERVRKFLSKD